jgi:large subunit ribosomal protein L4
MIEAPHFGANGKKQGAFQLPADFFDGEVNEPVMHQAVKVFLANQRQGTHATKTRRWVTGGNQKPWKQKGTGRARQGSTRSPLWPGGGTVFGPHPRDYSQEIPRKVKQLARRSALNARARDGSLAVVDGLQFEAPKTSKLAGLLETMGFSGKKVLVLTHGVNRMVYLSGRNIPSVEVLPYTDAGTYNVLWSDAVVVERGALSGEPISIEEQAAKPARAAAKKSVKKREGAARATKKPVKKKPEAKAAKKPAGKKASPKKKGSK